MIAAVAIETADGKRIVDNGPPHRHDKKKEVRKQAAKAEHQSMQAAGVVLRTPAASVDPRAWRFAARELR
jgi:hypothetical protein